MIAHIFSCNAPRSYPAGKILADGDSITFGYGLGAGETWLEQMVLELAALAPSLNYTTYNSGVNSHTVADMLGNVTTEIDDRVVSGARIKRSSRRGNICILFGGTNDLFFGASEATTRARQQSWVTGRLADQDVFVLFLGMLKRAGTPAPPGDFEANRVANVAYWSAYKHGRFRFVDVGAAAEFSDTGNTTYFGDGVHPTAAGAAVIGRDHVAPAVVSILETA